VSDNDTAKNMVLADSYAMALEKYANQAKCDCAYHQYRQAQRAVKMARIALDNLDKVLADEIDNQDRRNAEIRKMDDSAMASLKTCQDALARCVSEIDTGKEKQIWAVRRNKDEQ